MFMPANALGDADSPGSLPFSRVDSHDPLAEMEVNMRQSEETRNLKRVRSLAMGHWAKQRCK